MRRNTRWTLPAILALALLAATGLSAADHVNVSTGGTLAGAPLALRGFDPVSYFEPSGPVVGLAEHAAVHDGAAYRFTSAEHKVRFEANPERYAPAYGGFCAFGVSVGAKFDGDPTVYRIVDGRLFLNLNKEIQSKWAAEVDANIAQADGNWKEIRDRSIESLK